MSDTIENLFSFWVFKKLMQREDDCGHPSLISDICLVCGKHKKKFVK